MRASVPPCLSRACARTIEPDDQVGGAGGSGGVPIRARRRRSAGFAGRTIGAAWLSFAAGTYASPALLMRSGIGPAGDLKALGAQCRVDLPGVGRNLADHPWVPAPLPVTVPGDGPGFETVLTWHSAQAGASDPPDLQIFGQGPFSNDGHAIASLCAALLKIVHSLKMKPNLLMDYKKRLKILTMS